METSVIIRNAESLDSEGMKICVEAAYNHYVSRIGKPPGPMLDDYSSVVRRHQAFVADDSGQIIGVLVLIPGSEEMLLDNVAVHPDHQRSRIRSQIVGAGGRGGPKARVYQPDSLHPPTHDREHRAIQEVRLRRDRPADGERVSARLYE